LTLQIKLIAEAFKVLSIIAGLEGPNLSPEPNPVIMTLQQLKQLRDQIRDEQTGTRADAMIIETLTQIINQS
jgi:hypothetical protein